ncbi:MAG: DUF1232 domain-containing protein [Chloroflexi bacterium]|jgi:uncharacterized membrane protein YkvA (DUF1232 family)|nr:DUF1232 domain-containing protein [Chloroflexota bacterium]
MLKQSPSRDDGSDMRRSTRFYTRTRARIDNWLENHRVGDTIRNYLLLLPDFFALLERLLRDPRISLSLKGQFLAVLIYVLSPIDLIPDILLPSGLVDDTVAIAFILSRFVRMMGEAGEDVLREHWEGRSEILAAIRMVATRADQVISARVVGPLRKLFE